MFILTNLSLSSELVPDEIRSRIIASFLWELAISAQSRREESLQFLAFDPFNSGDALAKFKKKQKLLRRADFTLTMDRGTKVVTPCVVLLGRASETGSARIGFIVSKKVGGAVTRNLVKRRLREVYRTMEPLPQALDVVVIARVGADRYPFDELRQVFCEGMNQLQAKLLRRRAEPKKTLVTPVGQPAVASENGRSSQD